MTASVPELTYRTASAFGSRSSSVSAWSSSRSFGKPNALPSSIARDAAATIAGCAWPWMSDAKLLLQSMTTRPASSQRRHPSPRIA